MSAEYLNRSGKKSAIFNISADMSGKDNRFADKYSNLMASQTLPTRTEILQLEDRNYAKSSC